jgi:hypothetical protein
LGFAVNGYELSRNPLAHTFGSADEAFLKSPGREYLIDPVEAVIAGDTVGQLDVLLEPAVLGVSEVFDVIETLAAANDGAEGEEKAFGKGVFLGAVYT